MCEERGGVEGVEKKKKQLKDWGEKEENKNTQKDKKNKRERERIKGIIGKDKIQEQERITKT